MNQSRSHKLSLAQRKEAIAWLAASMGSAPPGLRAELQEILARLMATEIPAKDFNNDSRQLARALGLIASSERRVSGKALDPVGTDAKPRRRRGERAELEQEIAQGQARADRHDELRRRQQAKTDQLQERLKAMPAEDEERPEVTVDTPLDEIELTAEQRAEAAADTAEFAQHLRLGGGRDATLQAAPEALMNGSVVSTVEETVYVEAELPAGVSEEQVVKTLTETRERYDFSLTVTRLSLEVEKKVVVSEDGTRQVFSGSTADFGPPRFSVTWQALATLAVLVGQFALPFNRLATMLSTTLKRFTAASLSRMAHYVATRLVPVYLELSDQLADSAVLAGDDTSCRVVEVASYFARQGAKKDEERGPPPWDAYRTSEKAAESHATLARMNEALRALRAEGDREAKATEVLEPSLSIVVGKELAFESPRRDGQGAKQSLNTTVLTGRADATDPASEIVFYRSHLGGLGNLLEMLLRKRKASERKLTVQCDLSTVNLVTDPELTSRFDISLAGCSAHARRPFALYEDQDRVRAPYMLMLFKGLALHEDCLDRCGRNRDRVLAVRGSDSRRLWEKIKKLAHQFAEAWSKATPLGAGARYIIKHYDKLTAYLCDPRLDATNNLRERLLRTEKLIEKSSMFRRTIEGRVVLDILRTILQTAVAAGVPAHEYLVDVMRANPADVAEHPENYTPRAWSARRAKATAQA